jgi:ubiquinone/menaquinone biosynthesis C-methylase UbiE
MPDERRARRAAADQWTRNPAGTTYVALEEGSPEFFAEMTAVRYRLQPWHRQLLCAFAPSGRLLEIGCGAGTDHWELAQMGIDAVAIDLTDHGARRLELGDLPGRALVADGECLPFGDAAFDAVYSFGVIHHTDHPEMVAAEMYRVMRPGGRFLVALYHRSSLFALSRLCRWVVKGRFLREPWAEFLGLTESGADGLAERPVVRLYNRHDARDLFPQFASLEASVCHLGIENPRVLRLLPAATQEALAKRWGWYVVMTGRKAR